MWRYPYLASSNEGNYQVIKLFPKTGEILSVGNAVISAGGSLQTEKNQARVVNIFSIILVHRSDRIFTLSRTILIAVTGQILAVKAGGITGYAWIYERYAMLLHYVLICLKAQDIKTFATWQNPQKAEQNVVDPRGDHDRCTFRAPLSHECSTSSSIIVLPKCNRGEQ